MGFVASFVICFAFFCFFCTGSDPTTDSQ